MGLTFADLRNFSPDMTYYDAAQRQISAFQATVFPILKAPGGARQVHIESTHSSKSIALPVMCARGDDRKVLFLDNFHELNLHYEGPQVALSYEECGYRPISAEKYCEIALEKRNYSFEGWTEEEIADLRISRVQITRPNGSKYWSVRGFDEKERWLARFENADWYEKDWAGAKLLGSIPDLLDGRVAQVWAASRTFTNYLGHYDPTKTGRVQFSLQFESGTIADRIDLIRKLTSGAT